MARIVLVMHEPLGQAFSECARHVFGRPADLTVVDIAPDADPEAAARQLFADLACSAPDAVLMLSDIFGATPFNIANRARKLLADAGINVHLIAGTNLCMVLKALTEHEDNPEKLTESVRQGALRGVVDADTCGC